MNHGNSVSANNSVRTSIVGTTTSSPGNMSLGNFPMTEGNSSMNNTVRPMSNTSPYAGLLNTLGQQQQQQAQQAQQGSSTMSASALLGIYGQQQQQSKVQQQSQPQQQVGGINSPQFLELVSSLIGGSRNGPGNATISASNTSTNAGFGFGSNDVLALAQQMGLFQQQPMSNSGMSIGTSTNTTSGTNIDRAQQCLPAMPTSSQSSQRQPKVSGPQNMMTQRMTSPTTVSNTERQSKKMKMSSSSDGGATGMAHPTRIPCRARGMSMDHNFETAYFSISDDMKHGTPLVCSYPACRDKGVKFLYCAYCKDTGAKRQFRERHSHGADDETARRSSQVAQKGGAAESKAMSSAISAAESHNQGITDSASRSATSAAMSGNFQNPTVPLVSEKSATSSSSDASSSYNNIRRERKRTILDAAGISSSDIGISLQDTTDRHRQDMAREKDWIGDLDETMLQRFRAMRGDRLNAWTALLLSRPQDSNDEGMASWLMKVMAVSDSSRPVKEVVGRLKLETADFSQIALASAVGADASSSTEAEGSNDSFSTEKRSFNTDVATTTQDGSSNDSTEDTSSENQYGHSDEQDPASSSPTENESSDEENQDNMKPPAAAMVKLKKWTTEV